MENIDDDNKIDISIEKYISLTDRQKSYFRGYAEKIFFQHNDVEDPYTNGYNLCLDKKFTINSTKIRLLYLAGYLDKTSYPYRGMYRVYECNLKEREFIVFHCRSLGLSVRVFGSRIDIYGREILSIPTKIVKPIPFVYKNRDRSVSKIKIIDCGIGQYFGFTIDGNHRFLVEDFTVTHNTIFSIFLSTKIKYKTMVLCHRINLIDQWVYSINKVCPGAKIQIVSSSVVIDKLCDFFIMNVSNVSKKNVEDYNHIGLLIVDEAHTICTENMSKSLFYFFPKYLIFLTATPDRTDGKGKILELYTGPRRIERKMWRPFNVYVVDTGFKPKTQENKMGQLDWNAVLQSQCLDEDRNILISNIVYFFSNRNFLVLCKRVDQGNILSKMLKGLNVDVDVFTGTSKKFNRESRVLISTYSKTGVGFDHPKLDAIIIASDVQEGIEQYIGRVFRREDVVPIVFDLVDKLHTLYKHFLFRRNLYTSIGGGIKKFELCFPEFYSSLYSSDTLHL